MLAKVHIARKELGLDDPTYRALLARVTGHESAASCTDGQLEAVLAELRRLGWKPRSAVPSGKRYVRMIYAIWTEMGPMLGSGGTPAALRTFVQRQTIRPDRPNGVSAPEFLDGPDANKVIEGLKAWKSRLEQRAPAR